MRKLFQTQWQNIPFTCFATVSSKHLASADFYGAFYRELFRRYESMEDLPEAWRRDKQRCAQFVSNQCRPKMRVLSVGCGLGVIEHYLHKEKPSLELFVHEVTPSAWRWLEAEIPVERRFTGLIPECLPDGEQFDLIYLSSVDYALDSPSLISLLASLKPFLANGGLCLMISASFLDSPQSLWARGISILRKLKSGWQATLDFIGLRSRGQFWGWCRTREEYREIMSLAGYQGLAEGFTNPSCRMHFWIGGRA